MLVDDIFAYHQEYQSDIYGVDYTQLGKPRTGWYDPSDMFCDNVVFWCLTHCIFSSRPKDIKTYMALIRGVFSEYLDVVQFKVSYIASGRCGEETLFNEKMQTRKAADMNVENFTPACVAIKASFENIAFGYLLETLKKAIKHLKRNYVLMHDMDISMDLARISTRKVIYDYLLGMGIEKEDIVNDRYSVGDNCISWYSTTTIKDNIVPVRVKMCNKFIQMLESAEVCSLIGSQLSYLVANTDESLSEKSQRYLHRGMCRLKITLYGSKVYKEHRYRELLDSYVDFLG